MKFQEYPAVTCYTPKGIDLSNLEGYNKRHHWKYYWFIHILILKHLRSKSKFNDPVSLSGKVLQHLFGERYAAQIIQTLIDGGIIKRINYRVGEHAYRYQINQKWLNNGVEKMSIDKLTIRRKIHLHKAKYLQNLLKDPITQHEFLQLSHIQIDVDLANEFNDNTYKIGTPQHTSRAISINEVNKMKDTHLADGMARIDWMFVIDRSGRWHTPISHLAKDLRQFLSVNGERLVELDQACSQLTFGHKCLLERTIGKVSNCHTIEDEVLLEETTKSNEPNFEEFEFRRNLASARDELSSYNMTIDTIWRDSIFNGTAYQVLMDAMQWTKSKDEFKDYFFANLFFNKPKDNLTKMEKAFKQYFPHEFSRLRKAKRALGNKDLAVQFQRYESLFWHKWIVSSMRDKFRTIPFAIIHDSILVSSQHIEAVKQEIELKALRFFNPAETDQPLKPLFRIKG
jgi:hypothetical protein